MHDCALTGVTTQQVCVCCRGLVAAARALLLLLLLQIMPPYDAEMVQPMQELLKAKGVKLMLGDSVKAFSAAQVCF